MKLVLPLLCLFGLVAAYPAATKSSEQLELLVDQVYPEISTYLSRTQIEGLFRELVNVVRSQKTLEQIAQAMSTPIINALTPEQKSQSWESIQKAQKAFGGFQQLKVIFFHSLDAVQNFMGDAMDKDRVELTAKAKGKTEDEKQAMILETFRQYFNIEFGQKVMDTVKNSMTKEDWLIATEDAALYLNVDNFDMKY